MMQETMKKIIFIALIIFVLFVAFALLQYQQFIFENAVWIALALAVLILLWKFDFLIMTKDYERAVIFRFGKTNRVGGPGWALVFPPIENYTVVDLRTETIDVAKQDVVTKDSIELKIDAVIYLRVKKDSPSVINSVVEVEDYKNAVRLYVISVLRDLIGGMDLTEVISEIETLNQSLKIKAEKISRDWGIQIEAAEIKDVDIPRTVMDAMHEQKAAVQKKLARMEGAEAHKIEIAAVKSAAEELSDKALSYYYIRTLEKMGDGRATKIIFPLEFTNLLGAIAGRQAVHETERGLEVNPAAIKKYAPLLAEYLKKEKDKRKNK